MLSLYGFGHLHSTVVLQIHEYNISLKLSFQNLAQDFNYDWIVIGAIITKVCRSLQWAIFLNGASASLI